MRRHISRSGTLGYEAASQMKAVGIGISTSVGIDGAPINSRSFLDHLASFEEDGETEAVLMIGEVGVSTRGGSCSVDSWIKGNINKPVVGSVAGFTAPKGRYRSRGRDHLCSRRQRGGKNGNRALLWSQSGAKLAPAADLRLR